MSPRGRRRGGCLSRLVFGVVLLAVLLLVLDRGGRYVAEQVSARSLQTSQRLDARPAVQIGGFPFLNQFVAGRYDHLRIVADEVPVRDAGRLRLSRVRVDLRNVTASRDFRVFTARQGAAHATISYRDLGNALGLTVRFAGGGRLSASTSLNVAGVRLSPRVTVSPRLASGVLSFTRVSVNGVSGAQPAVTRALDGVFHTLPLKRLPFDITVTSLRVDRRGLELVLTGKHLRYTR